MSVAAERGGGGKKPLSRRAAALLFLLVLLQAATEGHGKTFRLNSAFDVNDLNPGDGLCVAYLFISPPFVIPFCTLRGAVVEANSYPGEDVVELSSGVYSLSLAGRDEDGGAAGDIDIVESLTITGQGGNATIIDGKAIDRLFDIHGENTRVTLKNLSILNGSIVTDGGIVRNGGTLFLEDVVLLQGEATADGNGRGGLAYNYGTLFVNHSTLQYGKSGEGGGLFNAQGGHAVISGSTFTGNLAAVGAGTANYGELELVNSTYSGNGNGATLYGGGVENRRSLRLKHVTMTGNRALDGAGLGNRALVYVDNTIIAGNDGLDCNRPLYLYSMGHNIDGDGSCAFDQDSDQAGVSPGLRPLGNYGGSTLTHALYPFSPAKDRGKASSGIAVDQRGVGRPMGPAVDIGAVEFDGFPLAPTLMPLIIN